MDWLQKLFDKLLSLFPSIWLVSPIERGVRITGGSHYKIIGPGWYFVWPIIQEVITMEVVTQLVDLLPQTIRTTDGHELVTSGAIRYRIVDIEKAILAVQDLDKALSTLALGVILDYMQVRTLEECMNVEGVKKELRKALANEASGWGIKIEQVYLTDLGKVKSLRLFGDGIIR